MGERQPLPSTPSHLLGVLHTLLWSSGEGARLGAAEPVGPLHRVTLIDPSQSTLLPPPAAGGASMQVMGHRVQPGATLPHWDFW